MRMVIKLCPLLPLSPFNCKLEIVPVSDDPMPNKKRRIKCNLLTIIHFEKSLLNSIIIYKRHDSYKVFPTNHEFKIIEVNWNRYFSFLSFDIN